MYLFPNLPYYHITILNMSSVKDDQAKIISGNPPAESPVPVVPPDGDLATSELPHKM